MLEESKKAANLAYRASKEYVKDNHPALEAYFNDIWRVAVSKEEGDSKRKENQQSVGKASFISDETILIIAEVVVPFFSGIFSAIVAESIKEKMNANKKKATVEIKIGDQKKVTVEIDIDKKTAKQLLPYAVEELKREVGRGKGSVKGRVI
jgi:hypothetical protein